MLAFVLPLFSVVSAQTAANTIPARWGQASALLGSLFIVQGGKTQGTTGGGYTYSSAPSDGQMYALDLSSGFSLSSPPWQPVSVQDAGTAAPAVSFHTISPLNSTSLLLFGGDGSPIVPIQTNNDSAFIVHLGGSAINRTVSYQTAPITWNQPMRRVYHTSESDGQGSVWIVGGERADGSGIVLDQQWSVDTTVSAPSFQFAPLSPPGSLVGATSNLLSDGTLLLLGGVDASGQLQSMQDLYAYSRKSKTWTQTTTSTSSTLSSRAPAFPAPRRDHIAVGLPDQRLFIQGGASADLSTVYSDAWILDWSVNPPVWTLLNSTGGPGPRFGHSAVAYGREVVISFGWAGGNAAPVGLNVFDASTLTASPTSKGSWTGGTWSTTTYTPDPEMSHPTSPSSGSSNSGSSSNDSGSSASTADSSNSPNSPNSGNDTGGSSTSSGSFPTGSTVPGDDGSASSSGGSNDGTKAGAAIGAIFGAGLVVGAGYAVYRRRSLNNYRRYGDGSVGLLGFGSRNVPSDGDYLMEKGFMQSDYDRPYHRTDGGAPLTEGLAYGRKRGRSEGSPWAAGNIGHAMEGSGPHFRERIAIFAGRGKRDVQSAARFDMLADEGDGNSVFRPLAVDVYEDHDDEVDTRSWHDRNFREHSYAHVSHGDEDLSSGDLGRHQYEPDPPEHDLYSPPFEDRPEDSRTGRTFFAAAGQGYGKLADRELDDHSDNDNDNEHYDQDDDRSDFDTQDGPSSGPSLQSHSTASRSDVPSSSKSGDVLSPGGIVSFSDASYGRRSGANLGVKRSPTWWDRFMGTSLLERTASGRFLTGPNANLPIRDPAPPPLGLEAITESPRSRDVSEASPQQNPFADSPRPPQGTVLDEMGRRIGDDDGKPANPSHEQGASLSSIGSARTGASSHFESRLRGMDVIQRVRTGSSRRTRSTARSDTDSEPALSRGPTLLLRPRNVVSKEVLREDNSVRSPPGEVVWKPDDFAPAATVGLEDLAEEDHMEEAPHVTPPMVDERSAAHSRRHVSETPSITPLTTKRARLNPVMVSPLFPSATPRVAAPATATAASTSVRDKVKAFESHTQPNVSAWTASLSSAKSTPALDDSASTQRATPPSSPAPSPHGKRAGQKYYTHGLVPKAQLFVANPDHHGRRSSGSDP